MKRGVERSGSRRHENLRDIQDILIKRLDEAFRKEPRFKLDCQARLGRLVWLGESIECGDCERQRSRQSQFEGPPKYEDGRIRLRNEYYTR